jgi:hypothetical protein
MVSFLGYDCAVILDDDASGIAPDNCAWLRFPFPIMCRHTTVKAFDGHALTLVVDCPPNIIASLRQRFVEVVEESHD